MIISASYKTDIPAFYGDWFMNRLRAGYCRMVNPYGRQVYLVDLRKDAVDGIVFWTKNLSPFQDNLVTIREMGFPFVVQYTINGYPRSLETSVVDASRSVSQMKSLARNYGTEVGVWRYDTILFTSETNADFHLKNFRMLAAALEGTTNEVVLSFAQFYKKTERNIASAARRHLFNWRDPSDDEKRSLLEQLVTVAYEHQMRPAICGQRHLMVNGVSDARCIDALRLSRVAGRLLSAPQKAQRPNCGCFAAKDIGEYDTCPHGCIYCYAVNDHSLARQRFRQHRSNGEFLFTPSLVSAPEEPERDSEQPSLF